MKKNFLIVSGIVLVILAVVSSSISHKRQVKELINERDALRTECDFLHQEVVERREIIMAEFYQLEKAIDSLAVVNSWTSSQRSDFSRQVYACKRDKNQFVNLVWQRKKGL